MIVNDVKFNLVIDLGQQNLAAHDRMTISRQIDIDHDQAKFVLPGVVPYKRMATRHVQATPDAYFYFCGVWDKLGDKKGQVYAKLVQFANTFIPSLQQKPVQLRAELENLEHIRSCAEEMLRPTDDGGLGFKPEFVADMLCMRLDMAMFGFNAQQVDQVADVQQIQQVAEEKQSDNIVMTLNEPKLYQPSCMFDFGEQRADVKLGGYNDTYDDKYKIDGRPATPGVENYKHNALEIYTANSLSFVRGDGVKTYVMPDGQLTTNLPARFRQFLQVQVQEIGGQWEEFDKSTPLINLPPAMRFLVGLQFGQINVGTWNPFTLAAKKYFALQTEGEVDQFFWKGKAPQLQHTHDAMVLESFGELMTTLGVHQQQHKSVAKQFEIALQSYYAMNIEILSRVDFDGNDRQHCQMNQIFRFEGLEALVPMGIVIQAQDQQQQVQYQAQHVPANSRRSVIVSSSATMFATSVDKPAMFPPPIKVITCYQNVHHARVFGTHLFNVDFSDAKRELPECLKQVKQYRKIYNEGCPFFLDRQREFLLMTVGLQASIIGVLASAQKQTEPCFVLSKNGLIELSQIKSRIKQDELDVKIKSRRHMAFCIGAFTADQLIDADYIGQENNLLKIYQKQLLAIVKQFNFDIFFNVNTK